MTIKLEFKPEYSLAQLCVVCGCAPCQVLALNKVTREVDLHNREILVPISTAAFVKGCGKVGV